MAGSLIKIDEEIVTSAVASVTLTGIDSTYDVYMVRYNNWVASVEGGGRIRVTTSGTPDTTANYDVAGKRLRADTTFDNIAFPNQTAGLLTGTVISTATAETSNGIVYLFNFNNASEYSFMTIEGASFYASTINDVAQTTGGIVHTVAQSCDGVQIYVDGQNTASGTFTLYGLKK